MPLIRRTPALLALASLTMLWGCPEPEETPVTEDTGCPEGEDCTDECDPNPCMNEGICTDVGDDFECECLEDWTGDTCEEFVGDSFFGSVEYQTGQDDMALCDAVIDLVGRSYKGECFGCDYAFEVDATIAEDNSAAACDLGEFWQLSFVDDGMFFPTHLAGWGTYVGVYGTYYNMLAAGFAVDYSSLGGGYYPGPYWQIFSYDGHAYASSTVGSDSLSWLHDEESDVVATYFHYYDTTSGCPEPTRSEAASAYPGTWEQTHTMGCLDPTDPDDVALTDVFSLDLGAGDTIAVTVDTVSDSTKFLPYVWINGVDDCVDATAVDNYGCTFGLELDLNGDGVPDPVGCPTLEYTASAEGTHEIVVYAHTFIPCTGGTGEYSLMLDLPEGAEPTLLADDKPITYSELQYVQSVKSEASATF